MYHFVKWGLDRDKIIQVPNGQPDYSAGQRTLEARRPPRNRFGFFGQMVDSKGIWVILRAVQILRDEGFTDFSIEINGDNLKFASEERREEIAAFRRGEDLLPAGKESCRSTALTMSVKSATTCHASIGAWCPPSGGKPSAL